MKKRIRDAYGNNSPKKSSHTGAGNQESRRVPETGPVQNKNISSASPGETGESVGQSAKNEAREKSREKARESVGQSAKNEAKNEAREKSREKAGKDARGPVTSGISTEKFLKVIRDSDSANRPNLREIAGYLILIGKDKAARILALLPDDLVETISLEISRITVLKPEENKKIVERFNMASALEQQRLRGGREFARDLLERSLGRQKAFQVLEKTTSAVGIDQLDFLNHLEPGQLRHLLKDEPPRLLGIILSHLSPGKAAALLGNLPGPSQIIKAMGEKVKLSQEVMHSIAKALKGKIRRIGNQQSQYIDGPQIMAEILRDMDATSERNLLEDLGMIAPEVEASI